MRTFLLISSLLLGSVFCRAQSYSHTFTGLGGVFGKGFGGEVTLNYNLSERSFLQGAVYTAVATIDKNDFSIPYSNYSVAGSFYTSIISSHRQTYILSAGLGPTVGYETVNNGENELTNIVSVEGKSTIIYGAVGGLEFDMLVSEHYSLIVKSSQFYHVNSDFGTLTNFTGIGLRYYF